MLSLTAPDLGERATRHIPQRFTAMATVCLRIGYKVMSEIYGAKDLVANALAAQTAGFDWVSTSDHFHPRMTLQRPSPYASGVPGSIAAGHHSCGPRHGGTFIGPDARRRGKKPRKLLPVGWCFPFEEVSQRAKHDRFTVPSRVAPHFFMPYRTGHSWLPTSALGWWLSPLPLRARSSLTIGAYEICLILL
jgi:hypothetical protein